mgnify:CR=1 FL=1
MGAFLDPQPSPASPRPEKSGSDHELAIAQSRLEEGDAHFFSTCLKSREHWRLFETFRRRTLYLDIETTGMSAREGHVTVVGLYRDGHMTSLVRGETLTEDRLHAELEQTDLLVTFFGSGFDVPYLQAKFPRLNFKKPHFDLCFAARRLGMQGGLKHIEHEVQIEREDRCGRTRRMGSRSLVASVVRGGRGRTRSVAEVQRSRYQKPRTASRHCSMTRWSRDSARLL